MTTTIVIPSQTKPLIRKKRNPAVAIRLIHIVIGEASVMCDE